MITEIRKRKNGQIALPFVLLIGGIIIEIVIAGSFISFFVSAVSLGEQLSVRALSAANTGIYDATMKISSNKEFGAGVEGISYNIEVGNDTAVVEVSRSVDPKNFYLYTIESTATSRSRERKIVAELVVDQTTGQLSLKSIEEKAIQ
jgi:uncharacterized protein (UPF0333 family)